MGITVLALALVCGLGAVYLYRHYSGNLTVVDADDQIVADRPDKLAVEGPHEPLNILVMGSDSRDCDGCALDKHTDEGQRSDTTILIHLSADREHAYGVSIPRDTMVSRPECKTGNGDIAPAADYQMWNAAFSVGGPACTVAQVESVSGIRIDHFVVVDFSSFKSMVDAVGGVEVCIPEDIDDRAHDIYLPAGTREISGDEALSYVRVRHGVGDGSDLSRTTRQQAFIGSMANAVLSSGTLSNPVKVLRFLEAATNGLTVDSGLGNMKKLASLAYGFRGIGTDKIQFLTIPVGTDPADPNRVVLSPLAERVWHRLRIDKPFGKTLASQSLRSGSLPGGDESVKADGAEGPEGRDETSRNKNDGGQDAAPDEATEGKKKPSLDEDALERVGLCT